MVLVGGLTWVATTRIDVPLARPVPQAASTASAVVPGAPPALPWPGKGQGAVVVPAIGYSAQSGPESPVPVASLTKMTTAVVILRDHPVPAGAQGPTITVTAADVAEYEAELHEDESTVTIQVGETLTERQMLEALLTQSANDVAYSLALWDAGSVAAFTVKMNVLAASLGATNTHYVDASGYDPDTVSSAADVLKVAAVAMGIPTFAEIAALPTVTLPLVGTLHNIVTEVGVDGVIGVKSGYTSAAGACMVLAADRTIDGRDVLVLVSVTGQPTPPPTRPTTTTTTSTTTTTTVPGKAGAPAPTTTVPVRTPTTTTTTTTVPVDDLPIADPFKYTRPVVDGLLQATLAALTRVTVATAGQVTGAVVTSWGGVTHSAPYVSARSAWLPGWPGQVVASTTRFVTVAPGASSGTHVGTSVFAVGGSFEAVPLRLAATVPEQSVWWRLAHG